MRLGANDLHATWSSDILEVDEALQVLEKSDMELVAAEQKDVARARHEQTSFVQAFRRRRFEVNAMAKARASTSGRAKAKAKAEPRTLPSSFDQKSVRVFCPQGHTSGTGRGPLARHGMATCGPGDGSRLVGR